MMILSQKKSMKYGRLLLIVGLWLFAFLLPELAARCFMPEWSPAQENTKTLIPDREVGWLYKAHAEADTARLSGTFIANSLGLRDAELGAKDRPRVVFLGDSFTWGWGVPNGVRYTDKLQEAYPQYQMVNAGINGYSTVQEALLLKKYYQELMPDLIVLQIFHNDFIENLETQAAYKKPYLDWNHDFKLTNYPVPADSLGIATKILLWIGDHTYFYRQVMMVGYIWLLDSGIGVGTEYEIMEPPTDEVVLGKGMRVALELLLSFCEQKKLPLLIISSDLQPYQLAVVSDLASIHGFSHYALTDTVFKDKKDFDLGDHAAHWSAYGHQMVAGFVGPIIDEKLRAR